MKDVNFSLLAQEWVLDHRFPRPVMEKGYCNLYSGTWAPVEEANMDPNSGHKPQSHPAIVTCHPVP